MVGHKGIERKKLCTEHKKSVQNEVRSECKIDICCLRIILVQRYCDTLKGRKVAHIAKYGHGMKGAKTMDTIKSLAESLGKSKTSISNRIKELGLYDQLQKEGNKWTVPPSVSEAVKKSFTADDTEPTDGISKDLIAMLKAELEEKNRQIAELNNTNKELVKALQQVNYLLAKPATTDSEDIPAESFTVATPTESDRSAPTQERKGFFSRLFGK